MISVVNPIEIAHQPAPRRLVRDKHRTCGAYSIGRIPCQRADGLRRRKAMSIRRFLTERQERQRQREYVEQQVARHNALMELYNRPLPSRRGLVPPKPRRSWLSRLTFGFLK